MSGCRRCVLARRQSGSTRDGFIVCPLRCPMPHAELTFQNIKRILTMLAEVNGGCSKGSLHPGDQSDYLAQKTRATWTDRPRISGAIGSITRSYTRCYGYVSISISPWSGRLIYTALKPSRTLCPNSCLSCWPMSSRQEYQIRHPSRRPLEHV